MAATAVWVNKSQALAHTRGGIWHSLAVILGTLVAMISNANDGRRLKQEGPRCLLPVLFILVAMVVVAVVMVVVVEVEGTQRLVVERRQQGLLVVLGE